MSEIENNIKVSWQLVSQFVSWEFCRYMCEQSEKGKDSIEPDVLTFLRNMIVERTEKAASDITKHEIVAKFVMEIRTIQKTSRLPCIVTLSETLVKICPELETPVATLLPRLEGLLRVLEWNEDTENKELVQFSVVEAVNDFTKEACKVLPVPDLPQVVEPWLLPGSQGQRPKVKYKAVTNLELYQKAIDCLREEKITPTEAKIIAELLYEDKELETLFLNFSETETDVDSQQQSHSLTSSQPPLPTTSLQQSLQLCSQERLNNLVPQTELPPLAELFSLDALLSDSSHSETISKCPKQSMFHENAAERTSPDFNKPRFVEPVHLESVDSEPDFIDEPHPPTSPVHVDSIASDSSPVLTATQKRNRRKYLEFIQFVVDSSDEENNHAVTPDVNNIKKSVHDLKKTENSVHDLNTIANLVDSEQSLFGSQTRDDGDTSDCDKMGVIRFLTPTIFKKDYVPQNCPAKNKWLSDEESIESSIVTTLIDSHRNDPNFKTRAHISPISVCPLSTVPVKKPSKRPAKRSKKKQLQSSKSPKTPRQATLKGFGFSSDTTTKKPQKTGTARKRPFKLFDNDMVPKPLDESALFQKKQQKKKQTLKQKGENLGNKRRCYECRKTFKNPLELKKHVFIEHASEDLSD